MKKEIKKNKKVVTLNLPKEIPPKKEIVGLGEKMNKDISIVFVLVAVVVVIIFFSGWAWHLNEQIRSCSSINFTKSSPEKNALKKRNNSLENQAVNNEIVYTNKDLGFELLMPKDGKRFAVKEISPKGMNSAVTFGLPFSDSEMKKVKKEDYSEIFRIELVPVADLENSKKTCRDKNRQFPLCDNDDRELGRNARFVFVYTRYDKLDAVEKSKTELIPDDFDEAVFSEADDIIKSFRLILAQS
ncbi:MAG: hypothetical protein WAV73_02100 [Candidatus Moraniibacteriota bacterium]